MILENYNSVTEAITNLNISKKKKALSLITAIIFALIIVSAPIAVCINLMIYNDYRKLLALLIATFIILLIFLIDVFYLKGITEGQVKHLECIYLSDTFFVAIVIYALLYVIFLLGVF